MSKTIEYNCYLTETHRKYLITYLKSNIKLKSKLRERRESKFESKISHKFSIAYQNRADVRQTHEDID